MAMGILVAEHALQALGGDNDPAVTGPPSASEARTKRGPDPISDDEWDRSVVRRAFALLDVFTVHEPFFTLGDLAARANLPRSTAHRLASMLVRLGALQRRGNLGYTIGSRIYDMGLLAPTRSRLLSASEPYLQELHEVTRGTVHLAGWSGDRAIYLNKIFGPGNAAVPSRLGGPVVTYATALGKCLLAHTPEHRSPFEASLRLPRFTPHTKTTEEPFLRDIARTRADGLAYDSEESVPGISCIAAPILDRTGACVATISVSLPTPRLRQRATELAISRAAENVMRAHNRAPAA